ncbi:MAG: alkaline phosphatase family protein [Chloroflexi bacterium]|nr:alkaline phosphatase family protein [Chloroflexota bacterium]
MKPLQLDHTFVRPRYGGGSFADIPALVQQLFAGGPPAALVPPGIPPGHRWSRVVTLFIDAFGWRFFEKFQEHPLLHRFVQQGSVTRLTSQFPSTTSAHVTTLYTGLPVGEHGVYEWFYYEPQLDAMIAPLLFSYAGDSARESLAAAQIDGRSILPSGQVSLTLAQSGVRSYLWQPSEFAKSTYTRQMGDRARMIPYLTLPEALRTLTQTLHNVDGPVWAVGYYGLFDAVCHLHGPQSPVSEAELENVLTTIERWLTRDLLGKFEDTLLMVIADHGQVETDPSRILYLDQAPGFERLRPLLRTNRRGEFLAPAGSCRDFFVHARPEALDEAHAVLSNLVGERGEVHLLETLIDEGFFGPSAVSATFRGRAGNLVVLPYAKESVYWLGDGRFAQRYRGHHGGLTPQEMEIPLLLLPL